MQYIFNLLLNCFQRYGMYLFQSIELIALALQLQSQTSVSNFILIRKYYMYYIPSSAYRSRLSAYFSNLNKIQNDKIFYKEK